MNELDVEATVREICGASIASDARLSARHVRLVRSIARNPGLSFPKLLSEGDLEAGYSFFSNVHVTPEELLAPHITKTRARSGAVERVLIVHDSTDFSYRVEGQRRGLGRRMTTAQTFYGHFSLAVSADESHRPLGIAAMSTWVRIGKPDGSEQARWLRQIQETERTFDLALKPIHVFDREVDDFRLFAAMVAADQRFVARANDRFVVDEDGVKDRLKTAVRSVEAIAEREVKLSKRRREHSDIKRKIHPPRDRRTTQLSISACKMSLTRPENYGKGKFVAFGDLPLLLELNVIRVWEPTPPVGDEPVEWILYTNEPVDTVEQAVAIVDHYRGRWRIEEYFKALKTGCSFEKRQLHDYESLVNALAVFAPIANQLLLVRSVARETPEAPGSTIIDADRMDVLRALGRRKLADSPTAREVWLAIAALGGHIKYAPDPGWQTLTAGFERLETLTVGWLAAKIHSHSDQR